MTTPAITGGSISGSTLDIGGLDSSSFHVDANGNIWSGAGTFNTSTNPFYVTAAGAIKATTGRIGPFDISASGMNSIGYNSQNYMEILDYGDISVYSSPLSGGHANMRHRTDLVGEYIQVARLAGYGSGAPTINRYMTLGSSEGAPGNIGIEIVENNSSKFRVYQDGNLTTAGFVAVGGTGITDAGSVSANGWFRSTGATGWYNQTYGGGIFMEDSTWVRVYNGKNFYCPATIRAENVVQVAGVDGGLSMRSWTASSNYMSLATTNMSASEYCVLSDGTNTFLSGGAGGVTYIRAGNNDTNGQIAVSSGSVTVDSIIVSGLSGIRFPAASAVYTNMPSDYNFSLNFAYSNNSYMYVLVNSDNGAVRLWSTAAASDRRIKDNINENVSNHLNKFYSLKAYDFEYNDKKPFVGGTYAPTGEKEVGLIAQEVRTIFPNMVIGNEEDSYLQINYQEFCRVLIAASLDQNKRIEELSSKVEELESRLI
jgi:hypothetical protein